MMGQYLEARKAAVRAVGGARRAAEAQQLRSLGLSYRCIAREMNVDRDHLGRWFRMRDADARKHARRPH